MFRTEIFPDPLTPPININQTLLTIGSCFSETIGKKLLENKFQTLVNPYGTIYHPLSIFQLIKDSHASESDFEENSLVQSQEVWYHYSFHSKISSLSKEDLKLEIRKTHRQVSKFLESADWIFITLGTAIGYYRVDNGSLVSNCHKVSQSNFTKKLSTVEAVIQGFERILPYLNDKKVIFTLSPVRHQKETFQRNSVSKSVLRVAIDSMVRNHENVYYFPAYELMLDDLRDYRYYDRDMLHPNQLAQDYIWEKFSNSSFDKETLELLKKWNKIRISLEHRPFHVETKAYRNFLLDIKTKIKVLEKDIDMTQELLEIENRLNGTV